MSPRSSSRRYALAALLCGGCLAACVCAPPKWSPPPGHFRAAGLATAPTLPAGVLEGAEPKELEVDPAAQRVIIRYKRDGHDVVEVFRMR